MKTISFSPSTKVNHILTEQQEFALRLWLTPKLSLRAWHTITSHVKNAKEFNKNKSMIKAALSAHTKNKNLINTITTSLNNTKILEPYIKWLSSVPQSYIFFPFDAHYPKLLKQIALPPILMLQGNIALLNHPKVAIVGSRNASHLGLENAYNLASNLSHMGVCVTSGLAYGIDAQAHSGAIKSQGSTIAVLGQGIDKIYPKSNSSLYEEIRNKGLLISEFPLGTTPLPRHFPQRNRIISGLSLGTVIIEAALKSGTLITARTSLEQNREVFALPGSLNNPLSKGCHLLIKQGAKLVETVDDIIEEIEHQLMQYESFNDAHHTETDAHNDKDAKKLHQQSETDFSTEEQCVLNILDYQNGLTLEELAALTKMPLNQLHIAINRLIILDSVKEVAPKKLIKA